MASATGTNFDAAKASVRQRLTDRRFDHVQRVVETAARLAPTYGIDVEKAKLAALLHDIAKEYPKNRLLKVALEFGIVLSDVEMASAALMHGPVGAEVARREFGVDDPDVLAAIWHHTTGRAGMSPLEKLIYLADYIEPGRTFDGVEAVREAVQRDLDEAMLLALDHTLLYLISIQGKIHPQTIAARNELLRIQGENRTAR